MLKYFSFSSASESMYFPHNKKDQGDGKTFNFVIFKINNIIKIEMLWISWLFGILFYWVTVSVTLEDEYINHSIRVTKGVVHQTEILNFGSGICLHSILGHYSNVYKRAWPERSKHR